MRQSWTISVPEAGERLGLKSKDSAYAAAAKGEIPTIRLGKLLRVPVATLERMLGVEPSTTKSTVESAERPSRRRRPENP
jgi:excisionase family DNA binding protein